MSYDVTTKRCEICGQFITFKDFVDGHAGITQYDQYKAEHFSCRKALDNAT